MKLKFFRVVHLANVAQFHPIETNSFRWKIVETPRYPLYLTLTIVLLTIIYLISTVVSGYLATTLIPAVPPSYRKS